MPHAPRTFTLSSGLSFQLLAVEGGPFRLGSPEGTPDSDADERPDHLVTVPSFYLGQYPVTQALWAEVMGDNPARFPGPQRPVEQVSWYDAVACCNRLSVLLGLPPCYYGDVACTQPYALQGQRPNTGPVYGQPQRGGLRLPSEAEWEYAARGGRYGQGYQCAGSDHLDQVGWYVGNSDGSTQEVGLLYPNELGLYDLSGNVWEWCEDQWHDSYAGAGLPLDGSAWVDQEPGAPRVRRGGSWYDYPQYCRSAYRGHNGPDDRDDGIGFRLVGPFQGGG